MCYHELHEGFEGGPGRCPRAATEPERLPRSRQVGRDPGSDGARARGRLADAATRAGNGARPINRRWTRHGRRRRSPRARRPARQAGQPTRQRGAGRAAASRAVRDHLYLDSSALVKLVVLEPESAALRECLRRHASRLSSALAEVEVPRALRRAGYGSPERRRAAEVLTRVALVDVDRRILRAAATLAPPSLRTPDAIHLATALSLGPDLAGIITYDQRLSEAAIDADIEVWAPEIGRAHV